MQDIALDDQRAREIIDLARRYFWWDPIGATGRPLMREIAQIMHLGTYDDVLRLEGLVDRKLLAQVLLNSEPGWFDDRSWEFWRGRLSASSGRVVPSARPRRTFTDNAAV